MSSEAAPSKIETVSGYVIDLYPRSGRVVSRKLLLHSRQRPRGEIHGLECFCSRTASEFFGTSFLLLLSVRIYSFLFLLLSPKGTRLHF